MAPPIVGPTSSVISSDAHYDKKVMWRQARPFDRVLPYERHYCTARKVGGSAVFGVKAPAINPASDPRYTTLYNQALSRAYERLRGKLGDRTEVGLYLAESVQSVSMIKKRLSQAGKLILQIDRRDLEGARKTMGLSGLPPTWESTKARTKSFADLFLEAQFGWMPLVTDIYSALDVLSNQQSASFISGTAEIPFKWIDKTGGAYTSSDTRHTGVCRVRIGARVEYTNRNLDTLNRLGLVNPITFAYNRIPCSFVANWFFNVEQMCSLMTDFIGLSLTWTYTTHSWLCRKTHSSSNSYPGSAWAIAGEGEGVYVKRTAGLTYPTFTVKPFNLGLSQAATAAALVTQRLVKAANVPPVYTQKRYFNWGFNDHP